MLTLTTPADTLRYVRERRHAGARIAVVPTMGALHRGHLALVERARAAVGPAGTVVATIFVNPTQFDNPDDLAKYPGCDALFLPEAAAMYPDGFCTFVETVGPLTDKLCAVARPGHFRGVATVVAKLFNITQPDVAVFGQKDLQQVMIVQRLISDLDFPIELVVVPTVREADGLAMSSRNRRLSAEGRRKARGIPAGLEAARRAYAAGERSSLKLAEHVYDELLSEDGVEIDYCDVVDLRGFAEADTATGTCVLAVAAFIDGVRLIDHVALDGPAIPNQD